MDEPQDWARVPVASMGDRHLRARVATWHRLQARAGRQVTSGIDGDHLVLEAWPATQARTANSDFPGLDEQIAAAFGWSARPWRVASVSEALGVPAILRAVTLISNTGGMLSMEAWRNGVQLAPPDRPRLIVRPDPFTIPRNFYRDTYYAMATRGEAWWWVAARDGDGRAISLWPVPPQEVQVREDPDDLRYPIVSWRQREMPRGDMVQITLLREPGALRGYGPLQACQAAVSIAVESQEWAANFFAAGGYPNLWIKAAGDLSGGLEGDPDTDEPADWYSEIQRLKDQWVSTAPNTPKVTDEGILDVKQFDPNPQGAQMLQARDFQNGDAARMFGIPGDLLEYATSGSSLTYQNLAEIMTTYVRTCLWPNYLEPVEQTMSDLLSGSTIARVNVDALTRADVKTRFEVYEIGIRSGVLTVELAQQLEGIVPGDVEVAPVPAAPPAAVPAGLPVQPRSSTPVEVRCDGVRTRRRSGVAYIAKCDRLLSTTGSYTGTCPRCKKHYPAAAVA